MTNKEIVKEAVAAFVDSDIEKALSYMTEDVEMGWPGFFNLAPGKKAIREFMKDVPEMTSDGIEDLIADGDQVAATGSVLSRHKDGSIRKSFFCDVYGLQHGKIKAIKSYMVFEKPDE